MEIPDNLLCLFTAQLEEKEDGSYVIEVPAQEVTKGQVQPSEMYRAALLQTEASPQKLRLIPQGRKTELRTTQILNHQSK